MSVFLNDRASVGMTVEASGPFGQFCLDESKHHNVVMLAAGSGITPMMAMLRYIDDLRLETTATLLYCVRTNKDIIFESELAQLRSRLKTFEYHVLLSQPHAEWSGPRGRVSREFIENTVSDIELPHFFLCGPRPFMEASRAILDWPGSEARTDHAGEFRQLRSAQRSTGFGGGGDGCGDRVRSIRADMLRPQWPDLTGGGRGAWSWHTFILPAGTVWDLQDEAACKQMCEMDAEEGLDPESRAQGFVLTCVGHADGDVSLDA